MNPGPPNPRHTDVGRLAARLALAITLACAATAPTRAVLPFQTPFTANAETEGGQWMGDVAMAPNGEFVVVWNHFLTENEVHGRRFDFTATPLTGDFRLRLDTGDSVIEPAVALLPNGSMAVVWAQWHNPGWNLRSNVLSAAGIPLLDDFSVHHPTPGTEREPDIAGLRNGDFQIAWSGSADGGEEGISTRRFSSAGLALHSELIVNTYTTGTQRRAALCAIPNVLAPSLDDVVVAWSGPGALDTGGGVYARRLGPDNTPLAGPMRVNSSAATGGTDAAVGCGWRDFVVGWHEDSDGVLRTRQLEGTGGIGDPQIELGLGDDRSDHSAAVARLPGGGSVVAWTDYEWQLETHSYVQELDERGLPIGNVVTGSIVSGPTRLAIAASPEGKVVLVWDDVVPPGDSSEIRVQRFHADRIFADQFEHGLGSWSAEVDPDGDVSTSASAGMAGTAQGLRINVDDDQPAYLQDDLPADDSQLVVRFYLDADAFQVGAAGERVKLLQILQTTPETRRLATVVLRQLPGQNLILAKAHLDDDSWATTGFHSIDPGPHRIELLWRQDAPPFGADGTLRLRIDGTEVAALTALQNSNGTADRTRFGVLSVKPGAQGRLDFDLYDARRRGFPGPF